MKFTKHILIFILSVLLLSCDGLSQVQLTIEGEDVVLTTYGGFDIPRSNPTELVFQKNILRKNSTGGYVLKCGDDQPLASAGNLDGAVIRGNYLNATPGDGTHGMMLGFNVDYDVQHNRVTNSDYAMIIEGGPGMTYSSGGIAYNIMKSNNTFGINLIGPDDVKIYNNTFYSTRDRKDVGVLRIHTNTQHGGEDPTTGAEVINNIFYGVNDFVFLVVDNAAQSTLVCDHNVYYSEAGPPRFRNTESGMTYTFEEWQALGFDTHSVVMDPEFVDTVNFTPAIPLFNGANLGPGFDAGLTESSQWIAGEYPETRPQGEVWQAGAVVQAGQPTLAAASPEAPGSDGASGMLVYPNPAQGNVTLQLPAAGADLIRILDMKGTLVAERIPERGVKTMRLDISGLSPGLYQVMAFTGHTWLSKLVSKH